jgi:hypothetical protein
LAEFLGMPKNQLWRRLIHHTFIGAGGIALTLIVMHLFPRRDFISGVSIGTAYSALVLTAAALL